MFKKENEYSHKIYTMYDAKAKSYFQPFFMINDEVAIRAVQQAVNEQGHQFNKFPEDFYLYEIGEYDEKTGMVKHKDKRAIATAVELLENVTSEYIAEQAL